MAGRRQEDPRCRQPKCGHKNCDTEGAVAVLHLHFCGGQGPTALVFEDADAFGEYVKTCAKAGDLFEVRPFPYSGSMLATGKVADTEGYTPVGGAY